MAEDRKTFKIKDGHFGCLLYTSKEPGGQLNIIRREAV